MEPKKQLEIGRKNHNIETYLALAIINFLTKKHSNNEAFEKLNY
jgi:hypothetical protein